MLVRGALPERHRTVSSTPTPEAQPAPRPDVEGPVSAPGREPRLGLVPPAPGAPPWVKALTMLGQRLAMASAESGVAPRMVVAAPTVDHISAAGALAMLRPPVVNGEVPLPGQRVATVVSRKFRDEVVSRAPSGRVAIGGVGFSRGLPPMHVLDDDMFRDRKPAPVPEEGMDVALRLRCDRPGDWAFQRLALSPVVILTNEPSFVIRDLNDLRRAAPWWSPLRQAALVEPRAGYEWWLRRPIVVLTPRAARERRWLARLPLTALVVVGFSAWADPARLLWRNAPQMLVLGQRQGVEGFREWFDGMEFPAVALPFGSNFAAAGLSATVFGEPTAIAATVDSDEDDDVEWD